VADDLARGNASPSSDKLIDIGDALQHLGDLAGARKNYQDALTISRPAGDKSMTAYALMGLGSIEVKAANFSQAHKDYDEALALRNELGEKDNIWSTRVSMAELAITESHPADAEALAREGRYELQRAHKNDDAAGAAAVLVRALLAEGKTDEALRELAKAAPMAGNNQNLAVQLEFALARARAEAASGKIGSAKATLKEALAKATKADYSGYQLESRLALEEIEPAPGKSAASRSGLQQLQKDAKEKGFELIADKAQALQH
jgi:tetratricopeptide (TPR) repeat protein